MSDGQNREWRFYVDDMIAFSQKVLTYTKGLDLAGFVGSGAEHPNRYLLVHLSPLVAGPTRGVSFSGARGSV